MVYTKRILVVFIFLIIGNYIQAISLSADLFNYDENKLIEEFAELDYLENLIVENPEMSFDEIIQQNSYYKLILNTKTRLPLECTEISAPGKIPSFWWAFSLSIVGSYTLYGAVAGPIAVGVVYFSTEKNKAETKKAIYGCLTGTVLGLGIRYLTTL